MAAVTEGGSPRSAGSGASAPCPRTRLGSSTSHKDHQRSWSPASLGRTSRSVPALVQASWPLGPLHNDGAPTVQEVPGQPSGSPRKLLIGWRAPVRASQGAGETPYPFVSRSTALQGACPGCAKRPRTSGAATSSPPDKWRGVLLKIPTGVCQPASQAAPMSMVAAGNADFTAGGITPDAADSSFQKALSRSGVGRLPS